MNFNEIHYKLSKIKNENLFDTEIVNQQYRTWLDCMDVQAGLALY